MLKESKTQILIDYFRYIFAYIFYIYFQISIQEVVQNKTYQKNKIIKINKKQLLTILTCLVGRGAIHSLS